MLWGILSSLSNIQGSQPHLFSLLLEISGDILGLESPSISTIPLNVQEDLLVGEDCWPLSLQAKDSQSEPDTHRAALESYASELESSLLDWTSKRL